MHLTRLCSVLVLFVISMLAAAVEIEGCQIYPNDNSWNRDISNDPVHANSANYIAKILTGSNKFLHADFGSNLEFGIPFVVVSGTQAKVPITIVEFPEESDAGPFPIPLNAPKEAGDDAHVVVLDKDNAVLYELYHAVQKGAGWQCGGSAKFDLKSNALRPDGFTSADAAGLPILPGLARFDEANGGAITHALRFTVRATQAAYIHPATHRAGSPDPNLPPMGLKLRLKKDFDTSKFTGHALVILTALKKYGMFVADNGSDWFISGASDVRWNDDDLSQLKAVPGSAFEAVESGPLLSADAGGGSGGGGGTNPTTASLDLPKLKIGLDFNRDGKDTIALTGILDSVSTQSGELTVNIGGVTETFTLSDKGKGSAASGSATLKVSKKGFAKLQLKLKGSFKQALSDDGLTAENSKPNPTLTAVVTFGGTQFQSDIPMTYTFKKGKGLAKN